MFGWNTQLISDSDEFRYAVMAGGEEQLAGVMDSTSYAPGGLPAAWRVYFCATDADATVALAVELGGSVEDAVQDTLYGRLAVLRDNTGVTFSIRQV